MRERWRHIVRMKVVLLLLVYGVAALPPFQSTLCKHSGHRFVHDYIQFQCATNEKLQLEARAIGCVPTNSSTGVAILPGLSFTGEHFRYSCVRRAGDSLTLKITHCVDNAGGVVALGEYFMQRNEKGEHESMECIGNEESAKKVVFKFVKCRRENGEQLTEGNFVTEKVAEDSLRTTLQSAEIISCQRENAKVKLECTGCVATNGVHIAVTSYANVNNQWIQCRRYSEGCRLINVTNEYVDCKYNGQSYENGETFKSKSGHSSYVCDFGVVTKQGCLIEDELVGVGEARYVNGVAQACEHKDGIVNLGTLKGCSLEDGSVRKFMDTWTDDQVKRRCSWSTDKTGRPFAEIVDYACMQKDEEVPLNKIVQLADGQLLKCAIGEDASRLLSMRSLKPHEHDEYLKRKTSRLNLVEYYANGGKSTSSTTEQVLRTPSESRKPLDESKCRDYLPFCKHLSNYCGHSALPETGLLIEAYEEHARMQEAFERLSGARHDSRLPIGCENQLATFQKLQILVELSCQQTCRKCFQATRLDRLVSNLKETAHCG